MIEENLSALFDDFGIDANFETHTAPVLFDRPGQDIFSGQQQSIEYSMTYARDAFPGLAHNSVITIDGQEYIVREIIPMDDGKIIRALLQK
jgi:hypothetical protein